MLQARALFYALVVCLIVALMSGLLISLSAMQSMQQTDQFERQRLIRNVQSGVALLLGAREDMSLQNVSLYEDVQDSVWLERYNWGLFKVANASAIHRSAGGYTDTLATSFFMGSADALESAIYLADQKTALFLAGETEVKGAAYLPKSGVKKGYVSGHPFVGNQLIDGKQKNSSRFLPKVDMAKLEQLLNYSHVADASAGIPAVLEQSFTEPAVFFTAGSLVLTDQILKGRIVLIGEQSVTVGADCELEDVIIIAPEIIFEPGFEGQVQAFATANLEADEQCTFNYPSVLGLVKLDRPKEKGLLKIGADCTVKGLVFLYEEHVSSFPGLLTIEKESVVEGQVFGNSNVEIKGAVYGNVTAKNFYLNTGSAIYVNYLLDATIDRSGLSTHYLNPLLTGESKELSIAQWVD